MSEINSKIVDKLISLEMALPVIPLKIALFVVSQSIQAGKKYIKISIEEIAKFLEIEAFEVDEWIHYLEQTKILTKRGHMVVYLQPNKVIAQWKPIPSTPVKIVEEKKKNNHRDIVEVFNVFREINPMINYGHRTNRKAAEDLVERFGLEQTIALANFATCKALRDDRFAPVITTPHQLKEKLGQLKLYADRLKGKSATTISI